ncbi:Peptidoglycan-binding protein ArfA [BD1-7 clade bacterium]|uniref:Peptidoglycan-binding protein ArfA n=1 Tax=BD1-7 clade bacterium TaxID=2029982 RepID=A0A5S9P4G1_9GAMM|nr:Peptidoglycan-binding protein ArfA [BD1-7 clade bacterium]CAA0098298.1 Peptidoglycan-binding protein ArfA [BD1-7 clade bacterium]
MTASLKRGTALRNSLVVAATILATTACVSNEKYDDLQKQYDDQAQELKELTDYNQLLDQEMAILENERIELNQMFQEMLIADQLEMEMLANGLNIVLPEAVLFPSGDALLSDKGNEILTRLADELKNVEYQIVITGYTDTVPIGSKLKERYSSNWELAGARAANVADLMAGAGIPANQLAAVSFGETRPIASNDTPEGRAKNRRIEIRLRPVIADQPASHAGSMIEDS